MSVSKYLTVQASVGLHARPAAEFVKLAQGFNGSVSLQKEDQVVDGKSMIGVLSLGIERDNPFTLVLDGEDEEIYISKFEELLNSYE